MNLYLFQKILAIGTMVLHILLLVLIIYVIYRAITHKGKSFLESYIFDKRIIIVTSFSFISLVVSLIFSELYHVLPCSLCWIQRILILLHLIIGVFFLIKKNTTYYYFLCLAIPGFLVAAYQTMTQFQLKAVPLLECVAIPGADCAKINMLEFGYITIPVMSMTFFAFVIVLFSKKLE